MKFFMNLGKFLLSIVLMLLLVFVYDIYNFLEWGKNRLIDKFVIHFVLSNDLNDADVNTIFETIKTNVKNLKFEEMSYITKQQIFDELKQKDELAAVLDVIQHNPFSNVIRIKLENYSKTEFENLITVSNTIPFIKQNIFDYNIKTYLDRIDKWIPVINTGYKTIFVCLLVYILFSLVNIRNLQMNIFFVLMFTIVYPFVVIENMKLLKNLININLFSKPDLLTISVFVVIYLTCVLQNFNFVYNKNKNLEVGIEINE
jgi:hypothetical protein